MSARLLLLPLLLALCVAFPGLTHAAPAPLRKMAETAPQPEVHLSGWLRGQAVVGEPTAITRQSDWQAVAAAWNIQNPPKVDFRTHFLAVHVCVGHGEIVFTVDDRGELRIVRTIVRHLKCCEE